MMTNALTTLAGRLASLRQSYELTGSRRPTFSKWLRAHPELVREKMEAADRLATEHLSRDFRGWVRDWDWRRGQPIMVGSGRRAEWCHVVYLQYALIAQILHERLGWTGQRVRDAARALQRGMDGGGPDWQPPAEPVPTKEMLSIARAPTARYDETAIQREETSQREGVPAELCVRRTQWQIWLHQVAAYSWGSYMLSVIIAELRHDPSKKTSSLVVGEILRLRGGNHTDYRGCSGCQYLDIVADLSDETQEWLLSRAGSATPVQIGPLAGMHVPFGLPCPSEYDHCLALTLGYEIRVRSAEWSALDGAAQARFVVGRHAPPNNLPPGHPNVR